MPGTIIFQIICDLKELTQCLKLLAGARYYAMHKGDEKEEVQWLELE